MKPYTRLRPVLTTYSLYDGGSFTSNQQIYTGFERLEVWAEGKRPVGQRHLPNGQQYTKTIVDLPKGSQSLTWVAGIYHPENGGWIENRNCYEVIEGAIGISNDDPFLESSEDIAYNKALSKLVDQIRGDVDLSIDALQGKQTLDTLRSYMPPSMVDRVRQLSGALSKVERRARTLEKLLKKAGKSSKAIANEWLAFTYGVAPTLGTIYGCVEKMGELGQKPDFNIIKARASHVVRDTITRSHDDYGPDVTTVRRYRSDRVEIGVCMSAPSSIEALAGYTSLNPVSMAWELLPGSFIVDWIFNVGGYLRNFETALVSQLSFQYGYITYTSAYRNSLSHFKRRAVPHQNNNLLTRYCTGSTEIRTKRRELLSAFPYPRPPKFKCDLGSSRLLSAAALLRGLLK